ncbi:hypothetical protein F5Y07DRAFT_1899 [Xylaria sp. FL0933]|nr:hypothetical protein F5Y07DRAFT_1899 [Xylaria sp. FL0933]
MIPLLQRYIPPALLGTHTYLPKIHSRLCMDFAGPAVEAPLCTFGSVLMVLSFSLSAPTNHQGGVFWFSVQHLISHKRPVPCPSSIVETPHHLNILMGVLLHSQSLFFFNSPSARLVLAGHGARDQDVCRYDTSYGSSEQLATNPSAPGSKVIGVPRLFVLLQRNRILCRQAPVVAIKFKGSYYTMPVSSLFSPFDLHDLLRKKRPICLSLCTGKGTD